MTARAWAHIRRNPGLGMSYPQALSLVYINEAQLRAIRAESRAVAQINPFCIGAQRNRIAYTVGKGHKYKGLAGGQGRMSPEEGEQLLSDCRDVIDEFCRLNRWPARQRKPSAGWTATARRSGDFSSTPTRACCTSASSSRCAFRTWGCPGPGSASSSSSTTTATIWRRRRPTTSRTSGRLGEAVGEPVKVDATKIQHLKANVDLCSPRGLPTWYALSSHFDRAMRLLRNINSVAEVQASIAVIRKHVGATRDIVQQALSKDAASVVGGHGRARAGRTT